MTRIGTEALKTTEPFNGNRCDAGSRTREVSSCPSKLHCLGQVVLKKVFRPSITGESTAPVRLSSPLVVSSKSYLLYLSIPDFRNVHEAGFGYIRLSNYSGHGPTRTLVAPLVAPGPSWPDRQTTVDGTQQGAVCDQ